MDKEERYREIEKRERLVQTFLIISGFLVAFTREEFQRFIVLIFSMYLLLTILYYIVLSRTRNSQKIDRKSLITDFLAFFSITNILAFSSSFFYSLLILTFLGLQLTNGFSSLDLGFLFIVLTAIFTFSLLSPETSEEIANWFEKFSEKQEEKHPKLLKVISIIIFIIGMVLVMYLYLTRP